MSHDSERTALTALFADPAKSVPERVMAGDALRYTLVKADELTTAESLSSDIIRLGTPYLGTSENRQAELDIYNALERAYITRAPNDFHDYLIALEWKRPAASRFYQPRRMVLEAVAHDLTDMMVNDLYDVLLLSMPPRVGKSTLGLFFLSWLIGRDPSSPILATGYAEKITKMFYNGIKGAYEDSEYNYRAIFPLIELVDTSAEDLTLDFRDDSKSATRKYKSITCRAIDGSLHGATEARQLLYCDDLIRDLEEALNVNRVLMVRDKMVTNLYSRKKEGCKELHIGTRWSIHDPMGWVEKMHRDEAGEIVERCKVINLPALDENDESNFAYPHEGFSTKFYHDVRRNYQEGKEDGDEVTWLCVYQQTPIEREGLLFPAGDLKYCYSLPDLDGHPPDDIFAFCDVAFGGADFLSLPIAYQWGDDPPIIVDAVFLRGDYKITEPIVAGTLVRLKVGRSVFEADNGGDFYSRDVAKLVKELNHTMLITSARAGSKKSKGARIEQHSAAIRAFTFMHPSVEGLSPGYRQFITNLTTYTVNAKNANDDAPDSLAGLAAMLRTNLNATVKVYDRRHI